MPEKSERGFAQFPEVECSYGSKVKVYESSAASGPHLWLNVDSRPWANPEHFAYKDNFAAQASAHLTLDQARDLCNRLQTAIMFMEQRDRNWIGDDDA